MTLPHVVRLVNVKRRSLAATQTKDAVMRLSVARKTNVETERKKSAAPRKRRRVAKQRIHAVRRMRTVALKKNVVIQVCATLSHTLS